MDFENSCLPKSQRQAAFTVAALHQWDIDLEDPRCVESAEEVCVPHSILSLSHNTPGESSGLRRHSPPSLSVVLFPV